MLFLAGTAGAVGDPDTIIVTTDKSWVIANNVDQTTVTVSVLNSTSGYSGGVPGVLVTLDVNSIYGTLNPTAVITGSDGTASSIFRTGNRSGVAQITAANTSLDLSGSTGQNIDHDLRQIFSPTYTPGDETVGNTITLMIPVTDEWGNPIDSRRVTDTVSLSVSCPMPNDCEFVGTGHSLLAQPDSGGIITTQLKLGNKTGDTIIVIDPAEDLTQQSFMIDTIAATPPILTVDISPAAESPSDIPTLSVTSGELFDLVYTLSDVYGNPVADHRVLVTTTLNTTLTLYANTSADGQTAEFNIGSPGFAALVDITATVEDMPGITNKTTVAFANAEPSMSLSVSPLNMGSLDYVPPSQADVVVLVRDDLGNPISGQDITLTLDYTWDANWTDAPYLANTPGLSTYQDVTDSDGRVSTIFTPGAFVEGSNWQATADLTATWEQDPSSTPKTATITWSNRPYININTSIFPQTIKVGDVVDVTINITVNGEPSSQQGPLTIVLDQDDSSSMGSSAGGSTCREQDAIEASTTFINKLNDDTTQMGLELFGVPKTSFGHLPIGSTFADITAELQKFYDGTNAPRGNSQNEASSIDTSLQKIIDATGPTSGHQNDVKILVVLSDGGQQLESSTPNIDYLIAKANGKGILIFTICYNNNGEQGTGPVSLRNLAEGTGGQYFLATSADQLDAKYEELFDIIQELCGQGSEMKVSFQDIQVNKTYTASGSALYDYVPVAIPDNRLDDLMSVPSGTPNGLARTSIIWPNKTQSIQNQSIQFPNLIFSVGRINLTEEWSTTFSLKVKQVGCYNVFGPSSEVSLGDGSAKTLLPTLPICVNDTVEEKPLQTGTLVLTPLQVPGTKFTEFIPMEWDTTYTTNNAGYTVTETLYYRIDGGPEKQFNLIIVGQGATHQRATLDIRNLPIGEHTIEIRLHPFAKDAGHNDLTWSGDVEIRYNPPYIKLQ